MRGRTALAIVAVLAVHWFFVEAPYLTARQEPRSPIIIDGRLEDWRQVPPASVDVIGDATPGAVDFDTLWVFSDTAYVYLRFGTQIPVLLQQNNAIILALDTDLRVETGEPIAGLGADLVWRFGQRAGTWYINGAARTIGHASMGLVTAPAVVSMTFEIALDRKATPDGVHALFSRDSLAIAVLDGRENGDRLPNAEGGVRIALAANGTPWMAEASLSRPQMADFRLLTWNILNDGLLDATRQPILGRLLKALQPELLVLQEAYRMTPDEAAYLIDGWIDAPQRGEPMARKVAPDIVVVSYWPIVAVHDLGGNGAFVIQMPRGHVVVVGAHLPCCENDIGRDTEIDRILSFLRRVRYAPSELGLQPGTPVVIAGDLNLVGSARQLLALLQGDILDEGRYGDDFLPDWDDTALADAHPVQLFAPFDFTWYSAGSGFSPGRLDFILFTDSTLEMLNGFVLDTRRLPQDSLQTYGLQRNDTVVASDHFPVVADFTWRSGPTVTPSLSQHTEKLEVSVFPNPFNHATTIVWHAQEPGPAEVQVFSVTGALVCTLYSGWLPTGRHRLVWDGRGVLRMPLASGVYVLQLRTRRQRFTQKVILLR